MDKFLGWLTLTTSVICIVGTDATRGCPAAALALSPAPHQFTIQDGQCELDASWAIHIGTGAGLRPVAALLSAGIRTQTGLVVNVVSGASPGRHSIVLQLLDSVPAAPRRQQGFGAINESYRLQVGTTGVELTAATPRGVQYAAVTFLQLLGNSTRVPSCLIDDKPDMPVRGFYLDSRPSNALNETFFSELAVLMGGLKMNSLILHSNAFFELIGASGHPIKPSTLARLQNISDMLATHQIDLIAEIGPYYSFESFEGLWVRDEPFRFSKTEIAVPIKPALNSSLIRNPTFITSGADRRVDGWQFRGPARNAASPCRVDENTHSPTGGRTVRCDVEVDPRGAHAGGVYSDPFPIDPQGFYYVQAWVKVNGTGSGPSFVMGGVNDSMANFGKSLSSTKGEWTMVGGTFASPLDSGCVRDCFATLYSRFVGSGTSTWWLADITVLRLNGALLNVIRTNATDINVTNAHSGMQYRLGVDFEVIPPKSPPQHDEPPFLKMYEAGDEAVTVRRLPAGAITPEEDVLISYDFGTNIVGEAKPNDPVAMAEPLHFQEAKAVIDKVMQLFPAPAVFFYETDEVRGINRDSRSAKLGLNNAELLARDMNALAGFVRANDPAVMPLFWGDMVHPLHNGGSVNYQRAFGGKAGSTEAAAANLTKGIGLIPWWYTNPGTDPKAELVMNASRGFWQNFSLHWMGGTGGSVANNRAWVSSELGGGGLGLFNTQWSEQPVLDGLAPAAEATWNTGGVNCTQA